MASPSTDLNSIIVMIAGRPYPLRVKASEEQDVRAMTDEINERFNDYQVKFTGRDKMDLPRHDPSSTTPMNCAMRSLAAARE